MHPRRSPGSNAGSLPAAAPSAPWCREPAAAPAHLQPFLAVETAELLVVHDQALAGKQDVQATITEAAALRCEFAQACAHARVVRSNAAVADRTAVRPEHRTRPPLAHLEHATQVSDSLALGSGRHHFFAAMSLSMALSSIASSKSFLSLVFSSSSAFNRLASDTSRPPYFAFHL